MAMERPHGGRSVRAVQTSTREKTMTSDDATIYKVVVNHEEQYSMWFADRELPLLGQTVARELFDKQSPVGQEVYVNDVPLRVIGVLSRKGADIIGEDQDDLLVAPWTTVKFRVSSQTAHSSEDRDPPPSGLPQLQGQLSRRYPRGYSA